MPLGKNQEPKHIWSGTRRHEHNQKRYILKYRRYLDTFIGWLVHSLVACVVQWLVASLSGCLVGCSNGWLNVACSQCSSPRPAMHLPESPYLSVPPLTPLPPTLSPNCKKRHTGLFCSGPARYINPTKKSLVFSSWGPAQYLNS